MSKNAIQFRLAKVTDLQLLVDIGDELFDYPVKESLASEFLHDPRHLMMLAIEGPKPIGMASGLVYVHPDKEPSLFIDEVGVVDTKQGDGVGTELVKQLVDVAFKKYRCLEAWVLTDKSNVGAQKAYKRAGGEEHQSALMMFEYVKKKPT